MSNEVPKPDDYITLKFGKEKSEHEYFMSAALLRSIVSQVESGDQFVQALQDPDLQQLLMSMVLCPRDERGKPVEDFYLAGIEISPSEGNRLLTWVQEHVLHFFIDAAETGRKTLLSPAMVKLADLLTGLKDLTEQKPSAGPTSAE